MLRTSFGGQEVACCVYNASGPRTNSIEALAKIGESAAGVILAKSATLKAQDGNPLPRFVNKIPLGDDACQGSVNSEGLPNHGIDYYISSEAVEKLTSYGKPYIVSLSGLSLDDNLEMLGRAMQVDGIAGIELNLACPNIPGKPTMAYDFEQMEKVLEAVTTHPHFSAKPLGVKLAPYFDMPFFDTAAKILAKFKISYVVCINTIGNALFVDPEKECAVIAPKGGYGGLGGGYVKQTALANIRMISLKLAEHGRPDIDVIGAGGVASGTDAFEMILCGAKAVQVGTCHWTEGAGCFARIASELEAIMKRKGYTSIEEFRGKLRTYEKGAKFAPANKKAPPTAVPDAPKAASPVPHAAYIAVISALTAIIAGLLLK